MRISDWSSDVCSSDLLGEGVLDPLVLADRAVEHDALLGILGRAAQRVAPDADRLGADQHARGIETVEDVGEALALLADPVRLGNEQAVEGYRMGVDSLSPLFRVEMNVELDARSEKRGVG